MGIDVHALNFLRYALRKKSFGAVATIGRQSLAVSPAALSHLLGLPRKPDVGPFCEGLLSLHFGAQLVDSYDYSDYEGATHIADLNQPFAPERSYDTIIDCGCVEHIYHVPQAMKNISNMSAAGGQILHVLPANNFCGHGFWQFSPELFFSLYSEANGYRDTEVFLADLRDENHWFEVLRPQKGRRAEIISRSPVYVLCRTCKTGAFSHDRVQQSDYVYHWEDDQRTSGKHDPIASLAKRTIKKSRFLYRLSLSAYGKVQAARKALTPLRLSNANRHLRRRPISELLAG